MTRLPAGLALLKKRWYTDVSQPRFSDAQVHSLYARPVVFCSRHRESKKPQKAEIAVQLPSHGSWIQIDARFPVSPCGIVAFRSSGATQLPEGSPLAEVILGIPINFFNNIMCPTWRNITTE